MSKSLLSISNVNKEFGSFRAVDDVCLDIFENEFFALLGASGSGKTTLLRMLAGFEMPSAGTITLDGLDITRVPANLRPVNLMFQSYALFPHMSVAQNIAYGLEMERLPKTQISRRVVEMLEIIKLEQLADRKPDQLSGGQKQRVALARALVKRPKLLLLDEPLGALDKKLRGEMQIELKRIQNEFGITFVIVTHDQEEALVMADRIAILKDGRMVQCGSPHDIYEMPQSRFVADFIGVMNFFPGVVEKEGLRTENGSLIRAQVPVDLHSGDKAVAAVRPERMQMGRSETHNCLKGTVDALAYHGLDLQLHLRTEISSKPVIVRLTAHDAEKRPLDIGQEADVCWSPDVTKLFAE